MSRVPRDLLRSRTRLALSLTSHLALLPYATAAARAERRTALLSLSLSFSLYFSFFFAGDRFRVSESDPDRVRAALLQITGYLLARDTRGASFLSREFPDW